MQYIGPMMDALRYTILAQQECQKVSWTTTVIFLPQYKTHKKSAHHTSGFLQTKNLLWIYLMTGY